MKKLILTSSVPCSVNHYIKPRVFITYKNGKPIPQVSMYETAEAKKYKKEFAKYVKEEKEKQRIEFNYDKTHHFYCDCVFYFGRIDQDCNNYFKLLLDAITDSKAVWHDDNIVCERVNAIYYDSQNPRIELTIYPVDYIGIFNNQKQLDEFKSKCIHCSRYKEARCSLLIKAIEGRIQEEISNNICHKFKEIKGV